MNKRKIAIVVLVAVAIAIVAYLVTRGDDRSKLVLHGNVDIRQIEVPFAESERIAEVLVLEGDAVHAGQVLARLETDRLRPRIEQSKARVAAQIQMVRKLRNGSRPEEIAQARAALGAAQAEATNATSQYDRLRGISESSNGRAVSEQDLDAALAAMRMSAAQVNSYRQALELAVAGPREEDVAQAQAQLEAAEAELTLLERRLKDMELLAPTDAIVRSRLMEPGELATPQRPVFSLAVVDPKWVRAYASEAALAQLRLEMPATVTTDMAPDQPLDGTLRFISPVAEFTPKTVQTEELRTSLVYEVRVFVDDPQNRLRLGMPASVHFDLSEDAAASGAP